MGLATEYQETHKWIDLLDSVKDIARKAGEIILKIYGESDVGIRMKSDNTPVTRADLEANQVITEGLISLNLGYPVLAEESEHLPLEQRQLWTRHWLVDPLDGTNEFIHKNGQVTVNIGLIEQNYPLLRLVYVPVTDTCYYGGKTIGAFCQAGKEQSATMKARKINQDNIIVLGSRSYGNA
ncbi:3'(2'),5'-bisphosphate nucleotidase CysQ [invertebrate metagenome]|uniref:3'(2'),5'-bisphosphate nucleotidase CysQ n=1 Tax=invertebrate metagenome TaxID=1711999 RepID=A0A2H9T686_9ZZZZ